MAAKDLSTLSDEDFMAEMNSAPEEVEEEIEDEEATDEVDEDQDADTEDDNDQDFEDTEEDDSTEEVDDTEDADPETDETDDEDDDTESQDTEDDEDNSNDDTEEDDSADDAEEAQETSETDYKAFYEQVTSEYKANGKMMPGIKDPDHFKRALSMAANYAQKTTAIKPHLGRIKMLQDFTDDDLNIMMDIHNGNQDAIKVALQKAKMDPLDIEIDKEVQYQATDHSVSQAEVEFDEVLDPIRDTPEFGKVSQVVTELWDKQSSEAMLNNPQLIQAIHNEIAIGRFDSIQAKVEQTKSLGLDAGRSDIEMYDTFLKEVQASEESKPAEKAEKKAPPAPKKKVKDPALNEKRRKAGIKHKKSADTSNKKYDPTQLSDEEFMKLVDDGATFINK